MELFRVFTNDKGEFGNPLGIIVDEDGAISDKQRQEITVKSGMSEVVFVNNLKQGRISVFSPQGQIPFAGQALVGVGFFLNQHQKTPITEIASMGVKVKTWVEKELIWVRTNRKSLPGWQQKQLANSQAVEQIKRDSTWQHTVVWAWTNQEKGLIRARTLAPDWGIPEDEANGSGSMCLAIKLNRELTIKHGKGSIIFARPGQVDDVEVGGRVKYER